MSLGAAEPVAASSEARTRTVLWIVFTTILIDFIGFSVLIPVLPLFAARLEASDFEVGLILAVYALAQLLFLPAWGWISDRFGRRPVILSSLAGTAVSFVVLTFAESVEMIYLSRALAGFFAASIGTAQAVVTDVTGPRERAGGMGVIGASFGLGLVLGPALGGGLAELLGELAPFYAVALLASGNLLLAWRKLPETRPPRKGPPNSRSLAISLIPTPIRLIAAVHERRIGLYLYLFFHILTAFAALEAMFTLYLNKRFGLVEWEAALIFAWIGVFLAVTQGLVVGRLAARFSESALVVTGLLAMAMGLIAIAIAPSYAWFFLIGPLIAIGNGIAFPSFTSLYSKACEAEQAGEFLGQSQSMATTGRIVGPAMAGLAMQWIGLSAPFLIAGVLMLLACALFVVARGVLVRGIA